MQDRFSSILTLERVDKAIELMKDGNYARVAASIIGIDEKTWYNWLHKGKDVLDSGKDVTRYTEREKLLVRFFQGVMRAGDEAQAKAVKAWAGHFDSDYRACRDFLERRNPRDWGRAASRPLEQDNATPSLLKKLFTVLSGSLARKEAQAEGDKEPQS